MTLPTNPLEIIITIVALLGAILLWYGIYLEAEKHQDTLFMLGSGCLLVYALYIGNLIFSIALAGFFLISLRELIQILRGRHLHSNEMVERYKDPKNG